MLRDVQKTAKNFTLEKQEQWATLAEFHRLYRTSDTVPDFPINITSPQGQKSYAMEYGPCSWTSVVGRSWLSDFHAQAIRMRLVLSSPWMGSELVDWLVAPHLWQLHSLQRFVSTGLHRAAQHSARNGSHCKTELQGKVPQKGSSA